VTDTTRQADLRRLMGAIGPAAERLPALDHSARAQLEWDGVPEVAADAVLDEHVVVGDDYEQSQPIALEVLFQPREEGVYEAEWVAPPGAVIARGEDVARTYRASDGLPFVQRAAFDLRVTRPLVARNQRVVRGDSLVCCSITSLALDRSQVVELVRAEVANLAQAASAAVLGLLDAWSDGGDGLSTVRPAPGRLVTDEGLAGLARSVALAVRATGLVADGDVVAVPGADVALAQGRVAPLGRFRDCDPLATDAEGRAALAAVLRRDLGLAVTPDDLLTSELVASGGAEPRLTLGIEDANQAAFEIARAVREHTGARVDVLITQLDGAAAVRGRPLNAYGVGATPQGATAGLVLYECIRMANAVELCRRRSEGARAVLGSLCARRAVREGIGVHRGYPGRLDAARERLLGFA
jgi:hypothetical protein